MKSTKPLYFPSLTGIRAIAAYLVFFVHYNPFVKYANANTFYKCTYSLFSHFHIGVSIFFVLSGFLITIRYQNKIELNWKWAQRYLRNRIARIYPMYFLITSCTIILSQISTNYDPTRLWKLYNLKDKILVVFLNLTFLRGFFDRYLFTVVGQGWSLTVEECFYLSAPILLLGLRQQWRRLLLYPIALLSIGLILVAIGSSFHNQLFGFFGSLRFMLNWTYFGRCLDFFTGIGLALYITKRPITYLKYVSFTNAGLIWITACLFGIVGFEWHTPLYSMGSDIYNPIAILIRNILLPLGIASLLLGLIYEQTWLKNILETKIFDLLGKSSYAFYLIHGGILNIFMSQYLTESIILKFIITNVIAILAYNCIEQPIHKKLTSPR
jgi:peptidoglycan/LPS O-acetylase OafA/YrhL